MKFSKPSESEFKRRHDDEVLMAFSAMDCVLIGDKAIYASTELTSGMRLYTALRTHRLKTSRELKEKLGQAWFASNIWDINVEAAREFATTIRTASKGSAVITPSPFEAPGWSQPEYLAFWEELIRTRIESVWFNRNWQYSNGCVFEFAVACHSSVRTCDDGGAPLPKSMGVTLIQDAIAELEQDGFDTKSLTESLALIELPVIHPARA